LNQSAHFDYEEFATVPKLGLSWINSRGLVAKNFFSYDLDLISRSGFTELSSDLVEADVAHCQLIVVSKFKEKLQQNTSGKGVKEQLQLLFGIYALSLLHKHQGDFLSTGSTTPRQASRMQSSDVCDSNKF
ncbi:hypothetical protein IFM89_031332, partial [Coptis chinensis]